eukprot:4248842-Amphidinium_carterae.1
MPGSTSSLNTSLPRRRVNGAPGRLPGEGVALWSLFGVLMWKSESPSRNQGIKLQIILKKQRVNT